jgi:hypothetical protein
VAVNVVLAAPEELVNALATAKVPRPSTVENFTTWPTTPAPLASRTVAVTVAGVAVVTVVVDSDREIEGDPPELVPVDRTEKPTEPVARTPLTVDCATTVSAPFELTLAGVSCTVTVPVASLKAESGLNAPKPDPAVENLTT